MNVWNGTGRLKDDPKLLKSKTGLSVVKFILVCERDKFSNDQEREADFIRIEAWRQVADYISSYAKQGDTISVTGRLQTRTYKNRNDVTVNECVVVPLGIPNSVKLISRCKRNETEYQEQKEQERIDEYIESTVELEYDDLPF